MSGWMDEETAMNQHCKSIPTNSLTDFEMTHATDRKTGGLLQSEGVGQTILPASTVAYSLKWLSASEKQRQDLKLLFCH